MPVPTGAGSGAYPTPNSYSAPYPPSSAYPSGFPTPYPNYNSGSSSGYTPYPTGNSQLPYPAYPSYPGGPSVSSSIFYPLLFF